MISTRAWGMASSGERQHRNSKRRAEADPGKIKWLQPSRRPGNADSAPWSPDAQILRRTLAFGADFLTRGCMRIRRALQGLVLAAGAPLGWLLIELLGGIGPAEALSSAPLLHVYLLGGTAA